MDPYPKPENTNIPFILIVTSKGLCFFVKRKRDVAHCLVRHNYMSSVDNGQVVRTDY